MPNILIFGNSGSGKSTLAKLLSQTENIAHLDLDTLAWLPTSPPQRAPIEDSWSSIQKFISTHNDWVIEGCYTDLLKLVEDAATQIIFMNLPIESCIANAKARPWEPHKYPSKQAQDDNLDMLINWIADYTERNDTFSYSAHVSFFEGYAGSKTMVTENNGYRF